MFRVYRIALDVAADVARVAEEVEQRDIDLARQMRRAVQSVVLNIAEGSGNSAGHKRQRFQTALGSARETLACVQVAEAMRIIKKADEGMMDRIDHVISTLVRLTTRRA